MTPAARPSLAERERIRLELRAAIIRAAGDPAYVYSFVRGFVNMNLQPGEEPVGLRNGKTD